MSTPNLHHVKRLSLHGVHFLHTAIVEHRGALVAFAIDRSRRIWYAVLDLQDHSETRTELDVSSWSDEPTLLPFPREITQVGYDAIPPVPLPAVKPGSLTEPASNEILDPADADAFLSSTARLTADVSAHAKDSPASSIVPFKVLSDGESIFLFRQSVPGDHATNLHVLKEGGLSGEATPPRGSYLLDAAQQKVPVVDRTLLCDRYTLAGRRLQLRREVRYRRSRRRHVPAGPTDTLGAADMLGHPFVEPTRELNFVNELEGGSFEVLQLPTENPQARRWQILAYNADTKRIHSFNMGCDDDGLFRTQGDVRYTSPDPRYTSAVDEPGPGACPHTGKALVPVFPTSTLAGCALSFDGAGTHVKLPPIADDAFVGGITIEAWVKYDSHKHWSRIFDLGDGAGTHNILLANEGGTSTLAFQVFNPGVVHRISAAGVLPLGRWVHIAAVVSASPATATLYVDGRQVATALGFRPPAALRRTKGFLGESNWGRMDGFLHAQMDELRLWGRALSGNEILEMHRVRRTGLEPDLLAYWRMDEGKGDRLVDLTGKHSDAVIVSPRWVSSTAPVVDNPGLSRSSYRLHGLLPNRGLSARLYHLQEASGEAGDGPPMKQQARVMLVATCTEEGGAATAPLVTTSLDLGISLEGTLAESPTPLALPTLSAPDPRAFDDRIALEEERNKLASAVAGGARMARHLFDIGSLDAHYQRVINVACDDERALVTVSRDSPQNRSVRPASGAYYEILSYEAQADGSWRYAGRLPMPTDGHQGCVAQLGRGLDLSGSYAVASSMGGGLHLYERGQAGWTLLHSEGHTTANHSWHHDPTAYRLRMAGLRVIMTSTKLACGQATFLEFDLTQRAWRRWEVSPDVRRYHPKYDRGPDPIGILRSAAMVLIGNPDSSQVKVYSWPNGRAPTLLRTITPGDAVRGDERFGATLSDVTMSGQVFIGEPNRLNPDGTRGRVLRYQFASQEWQRMEIFTGDYQEPTAQHSEHLRRYFGAQIALAGDRLLIGDAPSGDWEEPYEVRYLQQSALRDGCAVYEYEERSTGGWTRLRAHHVSDYYEDSDGLAIAVNSKAIFLGRTTGHSYRGFYLISPDTALSTQLSELNAQLALSPTELPSVPRYSGQLSHLDTDANGLTVYGARLDWAKAGSDAQLLDSIIGTVGLYYQSEAHGLMAAHYEALSARAVYRLPTSGADKLLLRARSADERLNKLVVMQTPTRDRGRINLTLTLTDGDQTFTETWFSVPADLLKLAAVLNGEPGALATHGGAVTCSDPRYTLKNGSVLVRAHVKASAQGQVLPGMAGRIRDGARPRWRSNAPGKAFRFDGAATQLSRPDAKGLPPVEQLTFEAWVKPDALTTVSSLFHMHQLSALGGPRGLSFGLSAAAPRDGALLSGGQILDCGSGIDFTQDFTLEAWTKGDVQLQLYDVGAVRSYGPLCWSLYGDTRLRFQVHSTPGADQISNTSSTPGAWRHWALVRDRSAANRRAYKLYLDGVLLTEIGIGNNPPENAQLRVFASQTWSQSGNRAATATPAIYDLRVWDHARSTQDIQARMGRDLTGAEDGLVGYFRFDQGRPLDHSRYQRHGTQRGASSTLTPTAGPEAVRVVGLVAGVKHPQGGVRWARSSAPIPVDIWTHIACTFRQASALAFSDGQYAELGDAPDLDLPGEVSVELVIQPMEFGREQMLICRGVQRAGGGQTVPYALMIDGDGYPTFMFEALHANGTTQEFRFRANKRLTLGQPARVAVVREAGTRIEERRGTKQVSYKDHTGKETTVNVDTIEAVNPIEWFDIRLYVDGVEAGRFEHRDAQPAQCDSPLTLASMGGRDMHYNGLICEARVWSKAISMQDPYRTPRPREDGLAGWWRIDEGRGALLEDSAGQSTGRVRGGAWVANPDPHARTFSLFLNGDPVEMPALPPSDPMFSVSWGDAQLSLGCRMESNAPKHVYKGTLEELRLWRRPRTQEQVLDQLFSRARRGHPELLLAYSFDDDSTAPAAPQLLDQGPLGLHLDLGTGASRPTAILSTVPIGEDAAQVRSTLNGVRSPFFAFSDGRPSAAEYSDLQGGRAGELQGVMKRCYSYTDQGDWCLVTGFKVGDLSTEYLGQVQFTPQVVGYVEGPPPLPSENMTAGQITEAATGWQFISGYSAVSLTEASNVTYQVSGSSERKLTASLDLEVSHELGRSKQELILAPFGVGWSVELTDSKLADLTFKGHLDGARTWTNEASYANAINRSKKLDVSLGAGWEDPQTLLNPTVGRRLEMSNMGYALVRSATADLYALRLMDTQALVSFRMLPDLNVPVDWNIIPFKINPLYTKQGTLDGLVGFNASGQPVCDPSYPNAKGQAGLSYHKPYEAYAYKRRIEREEMEMTAYLSGQSAPSPLQDGILGGALGSLANAAMSQSGGGGLEQAVGELRQRYGSRSLVGRYAKRNLVNTYVWTADGGFFAETEEKTDARSETVSGSFEVNASIALSLGFEISILSFGLQIELGASMGAGYTLSRSRSKESEDSFALEVGVNPPGDLMRYVKGADGYTPTNGGANVPGKVDAYRFMTFYMDSDTQNFDHLFNQVIDPDWLADDTNPNARPLREARQARKKPPCWRVFHRVTWVSRVLPQVTSAPAQDATLSQRLSYAGIASNWELINLLGPSVKYAGQDRDRIRSALQAGLVKYPELLPSLDDLVDFFALYNETVPAPQPSNQVIGVPARGVFQVGSPLGQWKGLRTMT